MNKSVTGKRNNPQNHKIPITDNRKIIRRIELFRPELNDNKGNFAKCIGLTIKILIPATNIKAVLGSP